MFFSSHALFDIVKNLNISKLHVNRYLQNQLETFIFVKMYRFDLFEKNN